MISNYGVTWYDYDLYILYMYIFTLSSDFNEINNI